VQLLTTVPGPVAYAGRKVALVTQLVVYLLYLRSCAFKYRYIFTTSVTLEWRSQGTLRPALTAHAAKIQVTNASCTGMPV
jgi:hypothetical protein